MRGARARALARSAAMVVALATATGADGFRGAAAQDARIMSYVVEAPSRGETRAEAARFQLTAAIEGDDIAATVEVVNPNLVRVVYDNPHAAGQVWSVLATLDPPPIERTDDGTAWVLTYEPDEGPDHEAIAAALELRRQRAAANDCAFYPMGISDTGVTLQLPSGPCSGPEGLRALDEWMTTPIRLRVGPGYPHFEAEFAPREAELRALGLSLRGAYVYADDHATLASGIASLDAAGLPADTQWIVEDNPTEGHRATLLVTDRSLTEAHVASASAGVDDISMGAYVSINLTPPGAERFCTLSGELAAGREIAYLALEGEILSAPVVQEPICGGLIRLSMGSDGDLEEATRVALALRTNVRFSR